MNAPPRFELYVLDDGEKPQVALPIEFASADTQSSHSVEITEDTKIPNAATIKIIKQDHTLANMLRAYISFFFFFSCVIDAHSFPFV